MAMEQEKKSEKLSYEQLAAYVSQVQAQAEKVYKENKALQQAINMREIDYAFKCLDHTDLFSENFIKAVVTRLEELLYPDPVVEEDSKEEEKE